MSTTWKKSALFLSTVILSILSAQQIANAAAMNENSETPWTSKINLNGDIRFRVDHINDPGLTGVYANTGEDLRARVLLTAKVSENLTGKIRAATGGGSSGSDTYTTSNVKLNGANGKKQFYLDVASLDWQVAEHSTLGGGKQFNPFFAASELVWDQDVTLEGVSARYARTAGSFTPFFNFAHSMLVDKSNSSDDTALIGAQLGTGYNAETWNLKVAIASYTFTNVYGTTAANLGKGQSGNTLNGSNFAYQYPLMDVDLVFSMNLMNNPFALYGTWVNNNTAANKQGWLAGVRCGSTDAGKMMLDYSYRNLESDATVGTFTDGEFAGGQTDVKGHQLQLKHGINQGMLIGLRGIWADKNISVTNGVSNYTRYTFELAANF